MELVTACSSVEEHRDKYNTIQAIRELLYLNNVSYVLYICTGYTYTLQNRHAEERITP